MARAALKRSAWLLISNKQSFHFTSPRLATKSPLDSAHVATKRSSLASYFLILNRGFCSMLSVPDSGVIGLGGKCESSPELTALLKSFEFSDVQIDEIIRKYPRIFCLRVSTNLKPKLDYLVECGLSGSALHSVVASTPHIFGRSLNSYLKPRYNFLKTYLMDKVHMAIKRECMLLTERCVEACVKYLEQQGVPASRISILLASSPKRFVHGREQLAESFEAAKALGIEPSAPMFVWYIRMFGSMNKTSWKKKVQVFKSLGWSDEDVRAGLLHYPTAFSISEDNIRRTMEFYINNVKADPRDVIAQPILLQFSLNERIIPRYEVLKLLRQYNLFKSRKISTFFKASEKQFMTNYIAKNLDQVPHLLQVYRDSRRAKSDNPRSNPRAGLTR